MSTFRLRKEFVEKPRMWVICLRVNIGLSVLFLAMGRGGLYTCASLLRIYDMLDNIIESVLTCPEVLPSPAFAL